MELKQGLGKMYILKFKKTLISERAKGIKLNLD